MNFFNNEKTQELDKSFFDKVVKINGYRLDFSYNQQQNFLYFDLFKTDGTVLGRHYKVIKDFDFGGFYFTTDEEISAEVCTYDQIDFWVLVSNNE